MKKIGILLLIFICFFSFGFGYQNQKPNEFYQVYLDDKLLGTIKSKIALEKYIDKNGSSYKDKFGVNKIYAPKGMQVKKIFTYNDKVDSISSIYNKIKKSSDFTIKGYEFKIKRVDSEGKVHSQSIYVLKKGVFNQATEALIDTFVGEERYKAYIEDNQVKIDSVGENVQGVYIGENITVKDTYIPVSSTIYTDYNELAKYLLFGKDQKQSEYIVQAGDTIDSVAFNNKVSPEEILISNSDLTGKNNLLYPGQKIIISEINPQMSIVEESYVVKDIESQFTTEEKNDDNLVIGEERIEREGVNGLDRVSQKVKKINGSIVYVDLQNKVALKDPVTKVVVKGSKYIPDVGSTTSWGWPTDSGWTLSSGYVWRTSPITGARELHGGLDISGTGYGSKIYATNNGRVEKAEFHYSYGNYVVINHNNGYLTLYGHMSRIGVKAGDVVARGDVIGYVGMTGAATGPHVHYEIWKGCQYCRIDPMTMY
ncbi:MAG: M23 family metallopeptidase [Bacilli bacterium]|nr:M23 family metallopeptidase [Bacilli bacterium]